MRICHLSWEFPPVVYGGLGRHVHAVATQQARDGHDVTVISHVGLSVDDATAEEIDEVVEGVRVIRVARDAPFVPFDAETLMGWVSGLESAMTRRALHLDRTWKPDVVHAHDWLTARAAATVTEEIGVPWVHTIHATEAGRHQGWLPNGLSRTIHSVEQWSVDHADRILVCSRHMKWEVERLFGMSDVAVIPNGIDSPPPLVDTTAAASIVTQQGRPLIVHTGRLEWEKGAHTVIEAMPFIRRALPDAHLVVAGRGSQQEALKELAHDKDVAPRVDFTGWLPDAQLRALVRDADVAVVPSIYEPFGIVALEAAVLGTPVVTSRAGGLAEFLDNDRHGWSFDAGNARELANAVISCVNDAQESRARADRAQSHVLAEHGWAPISERIVDEYRATQAKVTTRGSGARKAVGAWVDDVEINGNLLFDVQ